MVLLASTLCASCADGGDKTCVTMADCGRLERCVDGMCVQRAVDASTNDTGMVDEDGAVTSDGGGTGVDGDVTPPDSGPPDSGVPPDAGPMECRDGVQNGAETAVDCGGGVCIGCEEDQACMVDTDCRWGRCIARRRCAGPSCDDGFMNGSETGVDCGGGCRGCPDGTACLAPADCQSSVCSAGTCAIASCTDGVRNGSETGLDCGGTTCPACTVPECGTCTTNTDCFEGGRCSLGVCKARFEVFVDWFVHCSSDGSARIEVPGIPPGPYRLTAISSAGTVWNAPYYPPSTGWYYEIQCTNLSAPAVATPPGMVYLTPEAAFAALMSTQADVSFPGGTLICFKTDSACSDNHGGVRFAIERICP